MCNKEYTCNLIPVICNNGHFKGVSTQQIIYILKDLQIRRNIVRRPQKVRNKVGRDWDVIQNKRWFFYDFLLFPALKQLVPIWVGAPTKKVGSL